MNEDNPTTIPDWIGRGLCRRSAEAMTHPLSRTVCSGFSGCREPLLWEENYSNNTMNYNDGPDWDTLYAVDRYTARQMRSRG